MTRGEVFITGGTGYIGRALIPELTSRGHEVIALVRQPSAGRLPPNCRAVVGDPLNRETVAVAAAANVKHFVYLSVAQPAPMMKDYLAVRADGEAMIRAAGLRATMLRPWYVLGPGHRWPCALIPFYWICERLPATRDGARRLGLVTLKQMAAALVHANPPEEQIRILEVPQIRTGRTTQHPVTPFAS